MVRLHELAGTKSIHACWTHTLSLSHAPRFDTHPVVVCLVSPAMPASVHVTAEAEKNYHRTARVERFSEWQRENPCLGRDRA